MSNHSRHIAANGNQQSLRVRDTSVNNPQPSWSVPWYRILTIVFLVFATAAWAQTSPTVSSISPTVGPPSPVGSSVTIKGSNFGTVQGNSSVTFGGITSAPSSWSDGTIVVPVPSSLAAGFADVVVTVNGTSSNPESFLTIPVITGISPNPAPVGTSVTVTGAGFGTVASSLTFNGTDANPTSWAGASIAAPVPNSATTGDVVITVNGFTTNAAPFTVGGQIPPPPTITSVSPTSGSSGTIVTITGTNFGSSQGTSEVVLGGLGAGAPPAVASWSDTTITLTVPDTATSGPLLVIVNSQISNGIDFTVPPVINTLTPASGVSGTLITVNGTNFGALQGSSSVSVDGVAAAPTTWSATAISVPVPAGASTGDVVVSVNSVPSNALTFVSNPTNGIVTSFRYDSQGQLTSTTDPLNRTTSFAYTSEGPAPAGLLHTVTDAKGNVTRFDYDPAGNNTAVTDAAGNITSFAYDSVNQPKLVTFPDQSTKQITYDVRGRRQSVTDGNNNTTQFSYDDGDRLLTTTDANQSVTQYAYDGESNLTSITDASQRTTAFFYDEQGNVTQVLFPSGLSESYVYDLLGNILSRTDRNGNTINYSYDALNRRVGKHYPDGTSASFSYDLANRLSGVSDNTVSYGFAYDNAGQLQGTATQYSFLPGLTFANGYQHDAAGNRTSLTGPDGSTTTYSYDPLDRLASVVDSALGQIDFSYDALSRRTSIKRPNGVRSSYGYDSMSHLLSVLHQVGTVTIDGETYAYDSVGNRTEKTSLGSNATEQYDYDHAYRLTKVSTGPSVVDGYTYDPVGNRLSSLTAGTYTYNASNELTSAAGATYTYDKNGNLLTKVDASGTTTYGWDFDDRLISVVMPGFGGTTTFKYDALGRRIQKSSPAGTKSYLYDGMNEIAELDPTGVISARYLQELDLDEPLAERQQDRVGYYEENGLGSVSSVTDSTAALATSYTYDVFGNATSSSAGLANPFQFTARDYDSETGLHYYRARYYDSTIGRFISEDPLRFGGDVDFYTYAANSPTNFIDPFGLTIGVIGDSASVNMALQYLNKDPQSKKMIDALQKSSTVYTIVTTMSLYSDFSDPNANDPNIIYWNPLLALECRQGSNGETGAIRTPALSLGHELYHVYTRNWWHERLSLSTDPWWENLDEQRVIEDYENPAAKVLGEPGQRKDHGGRSVWVSTPLSQPKCNCTGMGHFNGHSL